jgi:hypothetical protein
MSLVIPIQPVPAQTVLTVLSNQNCQINIYQRNKSLYVDLNSNGTDMCIGCLALNAVPLDACNSYDGFQGNLYLIDTQGSEDPQYTGLGARWQLVYLTVDEVALTAFDPVSVPSILQLAEVLTIVAPNAGNITIAHGLDGIPAVLEIVPTSPSVIWGQSIFADQTNLYLVASDVGASATVLVYLPPTLSELGPEALPVLVPAATLSASSPGSAQFAVPHGLGAIPSLVEILPTSFGWLWESAPPDYSNVYFEASGEGVTAQITVFPQVNVGINIAKSANILTVTSSVPGTFSVAHGLGAVPSRIQIFMLSGGQIIAQTPAFDATNVYLDASDIRLVGLISVYA